MYASSTDWAVFLPSTSHSVSMCRPKVGMSNLGQFFCGEPWSEAHIGYVGGGWAGLAADQFERGDPEGVAGEIWTDCLLRLQDVENYFFKNLSNSTGFKDLLRAQCEEIREAKIGLNIMLSESEWILAGDFFPLAWERVCLFAIIFCNKGSLSIVKLKMFFY